jgi:hypothetical protein
VSVVQAASSHPKPIVAFSALKRDVVKLGCQDRWMGVTSATMGSLGEAVRAFNAGELDGLALTFGAGAMGIRLYGAKTLAMIGTSGLDLMAQAEARAPGAKVVLL